MARMPYPSFSVLKTQSSTVIRRERSARILVVKLVKAHRRKVEFAAAAVICWTLVPVPPAAPARRNSTSSNSTVPLAVAQLKNVEFDPVNTGFMPVPYRLTVKLFPPVSCVAPKSNTDPPARNQSSVPSAALGMVLNGVAGEVPSPPAAALLSAYFVATVCP